MGKASSKKHLKRQQAGRLEKYNGVKLSEALIELCKPYDSELPLLGYKKLMNFAILAWNIATQPKDSRPELILKLVNKMPELKEELETDISQLVANKDPQAELPTSIASLQLVVMLIRRKDALYPNDDRVVMDFKLTEIQSGRHLSVSFADQPHRVSNR